MAKKSATRRKKPATPKSETDDSFEFGDPSGVLDRPKTGVEPASETVTPQKLTDDQLDETEASFAAGEFTADNQRDPNPEAIAEEAQMAAVGEAAMVKVYAKRITPEKLNYKGQPLFCAGQKKNFEGQFTREEMETLVKDYFGGGKIRITVHDLDTGKVKHTWWFENPGLPNVDNIIGDLYAGDPAAANPNFSVGSTKQGLSGDDDGLSEGLETDELKDVELQIKKAKYDRVLERRQDELRQTQHEARQRDAVRQREVDEEEDRNRREEEGGNDLPAFVMGPGGMRVPWRPGMPLPGQQDPLDKPLTQREVMQEFSRQQEISELKDTVKDLMREVRDARKEPSGGGNELLLGMMASMQKSSEATIQAITQMNRKPEGDQDKFLALMKMFTDTQKNDKTMELIVNMMGVKEDKESNKLGNMLKMIEVGANLSGGAGVGGENEEWWKSMLRGIGDAGGALAAKLTPPGPAPRPPQARPKLPVPQAVTPVPGEVAVRPPGAAVPAPLPQPRAAPTPALVTDQSQEEVPAMEEGTPILRMPGAIAEEAAKEGTVMTPDQEFGIIINATLEEMLIEADSKPAEPGWIDEVFKVLPLTWLKKIANTTDYNQFIEEIKPYVDIGVGMKLKARIDSDPDMQPWLIDGFEQLKGWAQEQVSKFPEAAPEEPPAAVETPAPPVTLAPGEVAPAPQLDPDDPDVEPVKDDGELSDAGR